MTGLIKKLVLLISIALTTLSVSSQTTPHGRPGPDPSGAEAKLSQQQYKGQGLFLQRCSLCHLARNLKFGAPATVGPSLKNVFKNTSSDEEKDLRTFILNGTPHMPGFRYALSPGEMDDLIAYLKVM
jgi:mono/diheme cytochrome c family protein